MVKMMIVGTALAFAGLIGLYLFDRRTRARRLKRHRRANQHWRGYAQAWDVVFKRQRVRRITYIEPGESAEPPSAGADGGT